MRGLEIEIDGLKNEIIESKRDGYKEIMGRIGGGVLRSAWTFLSPVMKVGNYH